MADNPNFSLGGKVIVQCGGAGLLGPALVSAVAGAGATLVITSRDRARVEPIAAAERAAGRSVQADQAELDSEASLLSLRDRVLGAHGRIDGLVWNAVKPGMRGGWNDDLGKWRESIATNATGLFAGVRAFGDAMAGQGGGSIVIISSIHGMVGLNPWLYEGTAMRSAPDYFFHKAGVLNLVRYMATHYGPARVRTNAVAPGGIYDKKNPDPDSFLERYGKMTALGRMAEPKEIGGAVVFLLSDAASYVTGITLPVEGGYLSR